MERHAAPTLVLASRAHRGELACLDLALSAGSARLVTGGGDVLRVWGWRVGAGWEVEAEEPRAHRYGVTAARWARAGVLIASGGVDGAVRVWALAGRRLACRRLLAAPGAAAVRALCWAGGGSDARLVAGHDDGGACVWAVRRGARLARLAPAAGALYALAVLAGGALLLVACTNGTLKVYDFIELCESKEEDGSPATPLVWIDNAHDMGALCADVSPCGGHVATGGHDHRVRVWRVQLAAAREGGALCDAGSLAGHTAAVTALRWGRAGHAVLATASLDRSARLWAPLTGACLHVVQAHPRYLTCIALAPDLRYMITGSNDRTFRTWSLGAFSLDARAELHAPCNALTHFAVGDLEGIGPEVDEDTPESELALEAGRGGGEEDNGEGGACIVWHVQAHGGAINCIAAYGQFMATASSDGTVKVWRWVGPPADEPEGAPSLSLEHVLAAHRYPALACDFGAAGSVLLSAGLDGCAFLWDVQTGVQVRSLCVGGDGNPGGGGGGVRDARLSAQRPPRTLLATDDGLAPLWNTADMDPQPVHVYSGLREAAACCAWTHDARLCALGGAAGELRVHAPPHSSLLHHDSQAHDLGVTSCDFAPSSTVFGLPENTYLLATAGNDSLVKLWTIELYENSLDSPSVRVLLSRVVAAHGGTVTCVRWGAAPALGKGYALLASAGDDRWTRAWRVTNEEGDVRARECGSVSVEGAGGALAVLPVSRGTHELLAVGALCGELALWRLSSRGVERDDDEAAPRFWREAAVARWLKDYVSRPPDSRMSREEEVKMLDRARKERLTGARLLDSPVEDLVGSLGYGDADDIRAADSGEQTKERAAVRKRIEDELHWLRDDTPTADLELAAPHALLCPLSHRLLRWPSYAADGFTYERDTILEWLLAAAPEGAVSPMTGRRLRNSQIAPNYKLRETVRAFLQQQALHREGHH